MLQTEDLTKSYRGRKVVDGVCLEVDRGEVVGLLGPNGAGKTSTFYIMVGLTHPDAGRVLLDGEDLTHMPMYQRARHGISYLPQEASIFKKLTVEENILAVLETLPLKWHERRERLEKLLDQLGLGCGSIQPGLHAFRGRRRRRVEIARCLVISPHFILLDEPFSGIDPIAVIDIQHDHCAVAQCRNRRARSRTITSVRRSWSRIAHISSITGAFSAAALRATWAPIPRSSESILERASHLSF